jgi:hypothetical protein
MGISKAQATIHGTRLSLKKAVFKHLPFIVIVLCLIEPKALGNLFDANI